MKITEHRIVKQDWYKTDTTKTGWDSHGWTFDNGEKMGTDWTIISHIDLDQSENPFIALATRDVDIISEPDLIN